MSISASFWKNKRVFLTGHTGFKGSWLSLWLQKMGANLTGYSLAPCTPTNLFTSACVADGMISHIGDIRDGQTLSSIMKEAAPDILIHMAAQPLVRESYRNPIETYSTNVMGLVQVYEACRKAPTLKTILNVTSDKCYENNEWVWAYRENDAMGGYDPYSSSKGCAELVTAAYRRSYFAEEGKCLASARAGNVIGGGDWSEDRLIPDALQAFSSEKSLFVRNPNAQRPWQHVLEPLSGYLMLCQRMMEDGASFAQGWNFGPSIDQAWPVEKIVRHLVEIWGNEASWDVSDDQGPHEAHLLALDSTKAFRELNWVPRWNISEALEKTIEWQKAFLRNGDVRDICYKQIEDYLNC